MVKPREIIISVAIAGIMCIIGILIHNAIASATIATSEVYNKAFKPATEAEFVYGAKTSVGNTLAQGTLVADDPVTTEYATGDYLRLRLEMQHLDEWDEYVEEEYEDSDGNKHTRRKKVHHEEWRTKSTERYSATTYRFLRLTGDVSVLPLEPSYVKTYKIDRDDQVRVYGTPAVFDATLLVDLRDNRINPIGRYVAVHPDRSVAQVIKDRRDEAKIWPIVFIVLWTIATIVLIVVFVCHENDWLDGGWTVTIKLPFGKK